MKFVLIFALLATANLVAASSVKKTILKKGDCKVKAANGDTVKMHYLGTLASNGKKFDASYDRNQPFSFTVGKGMVIAGWEQGIPGICLGEKTKLEIPSDLAYGARGAGGIIGPNADLIFEVELLEVVGKGKV